MRKISSLLMMALLAIGMGLTSCVDDKDNPASEGGENVLTPEKEVITEDQMAVTVTADLPTAVLGTFEEGSTGAALVKRLSKVTATIGPDTRMVLLPGSMFDSNSLSAGELDAIVRLSLNGGYLAIERPTAQQLFNFAVVYAAKLFEMQVLTYQELYDMDKAAARRATRSSEMMQRTKTRLANIEQIAKTRGGDGLDDVHAEILAFGPTDYFMEDPFTEEVTTTMHTDDGEGNTTQDETITSKRERTAYISGKLADAYAEWLNDTEKKYEQKSAARRAMTRASGSSAINEIMDASETFRYVGEIHSTETSRSADYFKSEGVKMTVRSWGIHDMESNKDYYYVKQNITLDYFNSDLKWEDPKPDMWWKCSGYGSYNRWFGHFTSKYYTSMDLVGNGSIRLEAAYPSTDNGSSSTSITVGSSSSKTNTVGMTVGGSTGFSGTNPSLTFNASGSISTGTTTGNSFSMGMSTTNKDLSVSKNTQGTRVSWTYKTTLPQFYEDRTNLKCGCHTWPSAMLLSEIDMANEICWSVDNPSGQYTINIKSEPQDAALLYNYNGHWSGEHTYAYTDTPTATYKPTLQEPNRAMQKWRMFITINEWAGSPVVGAQGYLQSSVHDGFPDLYAPQFSVADKTATSLNTITAIIDYSKKAFTQNLDILQSYATSLGIKKYTISWRCDDANVTTREGFVVTAE